MTPGGARRLVVLAVAASLAGCSGPARAQTGGSSPAARSGAPLVAEDGGTVTVDVDAVPTTLNDHTVTGDNAATQAVCSLFWPQVFQVAPGQAPTLDTDVVQSAEVVSLNPQTVVYQINPKAVWSDGTPVTAQDFVYDWVSQTGTGTDVNGSPDSVASDAGYDDISSVTGSNGGRTVTVTFASPYADWMSLFDDLIPAHIAEKAGWNNGFDSFNSTVLVSGGPWSVRAWTPGRSMVLVRNPRWWATPAHLQRIVLDAVPNSLTMATDVQAGRAQVAEPGSFGSPFEASVSSSASAESALQLGTTSLQLVFDVRHAPLDQELVRQGIAHDIDRADLVTTLVQPVDPLVWEDNDHLFANSNPWYSDDATGYDQLDLDTGSKDLTAAGLTTDAVGTWDWHGAPVTLTLAWASDDGWSAMVGPAVAAQLVAAGFDVITDPVPSTELFGSVLPAADFDLALVPLATGPYPSQLWPVFGMPTGVPAGADQDFSGFDDPKTDALFDQATQQLAATPDKVLYQQLDAELWIAMPTLPLFAEPQVVAWSASLIHVTDDAGTLGPLWSATSWSEIRAATPKASARGAFPRRKRVPFALKSAAGRASAPSHVGVAE